MTLRGTAFLGACLALLVACASTPSGDTETELGLKDLVGDWDNGELLMQIADDGSYQVLDDSGSSPDDPLMGGFLAREGSELSFVTDLFGDCAGMVGVYSADLEGSILSLSLVDDPCALRASSFVQPWDHIG